MSNIGGPSREDFGVRALRGRFPIPFHRSLCHHDRDCPCNTGCFRLPPFPSPPCIPPGLLGSRLFFGASARVALTYGDTKLVLLLAVLERPVHGPRPTERALGRTQPLLVCCALHTLHSSGPYPPYPSLRLPTEAEGILFQLIKPFTRRPFSFRWD